MLLESSRLKSPPRVLVLFLFVALATSTAHAQPERPARGNANALTQLETSTGFLFVNGSYIEPPYQIEMEDNLLRINGEAYAVDSFDLSSYAKEGRGMRGGNVRGNRARGDRARGDRAQGDREWNDREWGGNMRHDRGNREMASAGPEESNRAEPSDAVTLAQQRAMMSEIKSLNHGMLVFLQEQRKPILFWPSRLGYDMLKALTESQTLSGDRIEIPASVVLPDQRETLQIFAAQFDASPEFLGRATAKIEEMDALDRTIQKQDSIRNLGRRISYPLTMFALVLVVAAVGHLLINTQPMFASIEDPAGLTRVMKATVVCLVIVALMSMIDLVWTLIANQNGTMRELNPLGSRIINNAGQLIAFKIVITSISIGLLFWFRGNPLARRASWWCCLVLTLLTARWLTFHSLFA